MKRPKQWCALIIAAAMVLSLGACQKKEEPAIKDSEVAPKAETGGAPKIVAAQDTFNFGKVKQGSVQEHVYKIRNEGTAELKIKKAKGS
jgi:hypothetical protein